LVGWFLPIPTDMPSTAGINSVSGDFRACFPVRVRQAQALAGRRRPRQPGRPVIIMDVRLLCLEPQ
jgi:hypothetical protein